MVGNINSDDNKFGDTIAELQKMERSAITYEIARKAVSETGLAYVFVPKPIRDRDLSLLAIKDFSRMFEHIPDNLIDQEFVNEAFEINPDIYCLIPDVLITKDMSIRAVQRDVAAVCFVPEDEHAQDIFNWAFAHDERAALYIPTDYMTPAMTAKMDQILSANYQEYQTGDTGPNFNIN